MLIEVTVINITIDFFFILESYLMTLCIYDVLRTESRAIYEETIL